MREIEKEREVREGRRMRGKKGAEEKRMRMRERERGRERENREREERVEMIR